ncbi:hypothetical protein [Paenirhodobacter ferrireducens]|uniref:hypothetical protein n=1 Tax=Paenirhodobacter ferrireducens TaxID=1215032 RepID=UPI0013E3CF1E|nr:hypothetical protein [Sinirhodobacter ferrireducens]
MEPIPLPHFLLLICAVILAASATLWMAAKAGVPLAVLAIGLLGAAALARLLARVE